MNQGMTFRVKIVTIRKNFAFSLDTIIKTIERARGVRIGSIDVVYVNPRSLKPDIENGRFTHDWFDLNFSGDPHNLICFHIPTSYRKKWGLTKRGSYQNDPDRFLEFWISCDRQKDFDELFCHETAHGLLRWSKQHPSEIVHLYEGRMPELFDIIDMTQYSTWHSLLSLLTKLRNILTHNK